MPPRVSVAMPVYNGERFLRPAIESILGQTLGDFEFLILDDASTDGSGAILAEYAARDRRIKLWRNQANVGVAVANNLLLERSQCEYVAHMDHDDISLSDRLAQQVRFLDDHPDIGAAGSWFELIDGNGQVTSAVVEFPTMPGMLRWCMHFYNPLAHPAVILRRALVLEVGGHNPGDDAASDYGLWCRLRWRTKLANVGSLLLQLRKHDTNYSKLKDAQVWETCVRSLQDLVQRALGRAVPKATIHGLYTREYPSARAAFRVAALIDALARAAQADPNLTEEEKRLIRVDAAERLCGLFQRLPAHRWSLSRWRTLLWIRRLNPTVALLG